MILLILDLITMFDESNVEPTLLSFNIVQCKTHDTCNFPNFVSYSIPYIMQKMQIQVYCYKYIYIFSN